MFANIQAFAISVIFKLFYWRLYANITETISSLPPKQYSEPPETLSSVTQTSLDRHQDHVQDHPNCHLSWPPQELYLNGQCTIDTYKGLEGEMGRKGVKIGWQSGWVGQNIVKNVFTEKLENVTDNKILASRVSFMTYAALRGQYPQLCHTSHEHILEENKFLMIFFHSFL